MRKEYVGYIRVAHEDDMAVENQKIYIENYAKQRNIKIDYYYIDNGFSGINLDRPQLKQMLREVKSKNIKKGIIVKDLSRISREMSGINKVLQGTTKRGVQLISTLEEESLRVNILGAIIQMYRKDELERKMMGQRFVKERGAFVVNPYKRGTLEDMEYRKQKREEFEKQGIHHVTFKYKDDMKKKVGTRDERN